MIKEENDLLTQIGRGTPCGELMRRYWQPAALCEELPQGGAPFPLKLLGEDLVLFRDEQGRPGLLGRHCCHRGADLSYGRVEDGGLRCIYHGWLYDIHGRCLDQPGEPSGGEHRGAIRQLAYPCREQVGVIFTYMGPGEPPLFPNYEFLTVPDERLFATKLFHGCNYLQANEGNIDLSHLSFLHYSRANRGVGGVVGGPLLPAQDKVSGGGAAPGQETYFAELTGFGVRSAKIREDLGAEQYHIYLTEFVLPNMTAFPGNFRGWVGHGVHWHVPIDDTHHWKFVFQFRRDKAVDKDQFRRELADMTPDYKALINKSNRYFQDRDLMMEESYIGIGRRPRGDFNFQLQDLHVTEGQGPIQDRTQERLAAGDRAVVAARTVLLKAIRDVQKGLEPPNVIRDPQKNRFRILAFNGVVPKEKHWKEKAKELEEEVKI